MVQLQGALTTTLAEDLDNSETDVDVADETGITTDNDVILIGEELMIVTATTDDNTLTVQQEDIVAQQRPHTQMEQLFD